jgi:hypothetical protein
VVVTSNPFYGHDKARRTLALGKSALKKALSLLLGSSGSLPRIAHHRSLFWVWRVQFIALPLRRHLPFQFTIQA